MFPVRVSAQAIDVAMHTATQNANVFVIVDSEMSPIRLQHQRACIALSQRFGVALSARGKISPSVGEAADGLFDNRRRMKMHAFKRGDVVTIFQMHPSKGLLIEGKATISKIVPDVDEQYLVIFPGELSPYERFVDRQGQENPERYVREFNKKIGKAA